MSDQQPGKPAGTEAVNCTAQQPRGFRLLIWTLIGACVLVVMVRSSNALMLHAWGNGWQPLPTFALSLVPLVPGFAFFGWLIWRGHRRRRLSVNAPKRRWFRFSLRTLLVVVLILGIPLAWVGYQLNWIRQRHAALARQNPRIYAVVIPKEAPGMLGLFGEVGYEGLDVLFPPRAGGALTESELTEIERLHKLFPETTSVLWNSTGQLHNGYPTFSN